MAVLDTLKVIASELVEGRDDSELNSVILLAETRTAGLTCSDSNQELATAYLSAHMIALSDRNGEAGSIGARKEGDLQINFSPGLNKDSYDQTPYGREFKALVDECIIGFSIGLT